MGLIPMSETSRKISINRLRWLLIGEPKIGKTAILSGFPNILLLATEKRYNAFNFHVVNIVSWKKEPGKIYGTDEDGVQNVAFVDIVDEICKGKHEFKTIAIDTVDILIVHCVDYVCKHFKIKHMSDLGFGKAYDMVKAELNAELNKLFMTSYGLIFTSHVKTREVIKPQGGNFTKSTSSLINQARDVIHPKVSAIGLMKAKVIKIADNKYKECRVISFKPSELEEVGDGDGVMPPELVTSENPKETYEIIKKYYEQSSK